MLKVIEDRKKQREERLKTAKTYIAKLASSIGKLTAILYGSTVKGSFKDWSDIDIVVIADNLPSDPLERLDFLYGFSDGLIEPKGFTKSEFEKIINAPFGQLLKEEGVVILDELHLFKETKL